MHWKLPNIKLDQISLKYYSSSQTRNLSGKVKYFLHLISYQFKALLTQLVHTNMVSRKAENGVTRGGLLFFQNIARCRF